MADTEQQQQTPTNDRISVGIEQDTTAVSFDGTGGTSTKSTGDSLNQEFDKDGLALTDEELAELEGDDQPTEGVDTEEEKPAEEETPEETDPEAELPEWDEANDEVNSAYDAKYITKDDGGKDVLNFQAFNDEFAKDRGEGKRDLNAGTRQYLKDRFGISDKLIDSHLAGVIAQEEKIANVFHGQFGATPEEGQKVYTEMFGWAKENFTPAQKDRYNAAMKEGGEAAQEQIELLKTRFLTKNPGKASTTEAAERTIGLRKVERGVSPKKNATGGQSSQSAAPTPFANAEEHRVAQNEALKLKGKEKDTKLAEVRSRLSASQFWQR
jgi:hypothetical protein